MDLAQIFVDSLGLMFFERDEVNKGFKRCGSRTLTRRETVLRFFYLFWIETFWFVQIHITLVSPLFLMKKNWEETFFVYDVDLIDFSFGFKGVFWFSNFLKPKRFLSLSSTSFSSDWTSLWEKRGVWSYTWGFNGDSGWFSSENRDLLAAFLMILLLSYWK